MTTQEKLVVESFLKSQNGSNKGKTIKTIPEEVQTAVNDLEKSLTKDDPLLTSNTYYDKNAEKNFKNHKKVFKENVNVGNINEGDELIKTNDETKLEVDKRPVPRPRSDRTQIVKNDTDTQVIENEYAKVKKKRRRRKQPRMKKEESTEDAIIEGETTAVTSTNQDAVQSEEQQDLQQQQDPNQFVDDGNILGVEIHHSDHLRTDIMFLAHPVVNVGIVDTLTGKLFPKLSSSRRVTSYYENETVTEILPLMTQPFDIRKNQSLLPRWNELLIFNEPFNRFILPSSLCKPILFFVIKDFVPMAKVNNKRSSHDDKGWYNIAWAFLKLCDGFGNNNVKRKIRLQLFHPPKSRVFDNSKYPVYDWWLNYPRHKYSSTLYVTVKPIIPPDQINPALRSMFVSQPEKGMHSLNDSQNIADDALDANQEDDSSLWSRFLGQNCKVPNVSQHRFWAGNGGGFRISFSNKGKLLAIACMHSGSYPIVLYKIPNGQNDGILTGHQQLTYDMHWSNNDRFLLTASGDGTAQVWNVALKDKPVYTLPHPTYVYTASFHPIAQHIIATGGYDSTLRVWSIVKKESHLVNELEGHKALINSLTFTKTGDKLFSADSSGIILIWSSEASAKMSRRNNLSWSVESKITDPSLNGVFINSIILHPSNNKAILQCRDSTLRLLDTRIHTFKSFVGGINQRQLIRPSVTPCGNFVFAGSEDGKVYVWNAQTQGQVAVYNNLGFTNAVHDVAYHPHDHMVAFCSFGEYMSVLLYTFDKSVAEMDAGFNKQDVGLDMTSNLPTAPKQLTSYKFDKVIRSLNEVDDAVAMSPRGNLPPIRNTTLPLMSTWGSTFESSPNTSKFTSIEGSPYKNPEFKPDVSLTIDEFGNKSVSVNAKQTENGKVLVLFDYEANRSDELNITKGEVLFVIHKDSDNWWFGRKASDGSQGYFPSAYVQEQEGTADANDVLFGSVPVKEKKKVHALKMPGGRLQFYSQSESEGDDLASNNSSRQRRRVNRLQGKTKSILKKPKFDVQNRSTEVIEQEVTQKRTTFEETSFIEQPDVSRRPDKSTNIKASKQNPTNDSATVIQTSSVEEVKDKPPIKKTKQKPKKSPHPLPMRPLPKVQKPEKEDSTPERFSFLKSVQSFLDKDLFSDTVMDGHKNDGYVEDVE